MPTESLTASEHLMRARERLEGLLAESRLPGFPREKIACYEAIQDVLDAVDQIEDQLRAVIVAFSQLGGFDVNDVLTTMLAGVVPDEHRAIEKESGFQRQGGFRQLVLDRLEAIERRLAVIPPDASVDDFPFADSHGNLVRSDAVDPGDGPIFMTDP